VNLKLTLISETVRDRALSVVRSLPLGHEIVIRPAKSKRSLAANALHWKRLDIIRLHIADSTGQFFSAEEIHEFFKNKFLPVRMVEVGGEEIPCRRTTTKLSKKEMSEFMDMIDRYCVDRLELYLPIPGVEEE
jgi:hypothetical protein